MSSIMIVEDEILIAEDIKLSLEQHGFNVTSMITSGEDAILAAGTQKPDAVIMDIKLQGDMNGITAAAWIYDKYQIPAIFLTSYADPALLKQAKEVGSFGYLLKPFQDFELMAMIEIALYKAEMEQTNKRLEQQLQQATKMEAIGTLAGGIAHDFNNLLSVIIGFSELVEEDLSNAGMETKNINEVLDASLRAKDLVKQILSFSRREKYALTPIQLKPIIKEAMGFLRASIPTLIDIRFLQANHTGMVRADPTRIMQVLINLCTNAAQAMENKAGEILIGLERFTSNPPELEHLPEQLTLPLVRLSVTDNGPGIDQKIKERIFDPYFTTKDVGKGSGLGLSIVHGIVRNYNGAITVASNMDKGSAFHVYLPETPAKPEIKPLPLEIDLMGKERILLVDDEETITILVTKMLTRLGYDVTAATSGLEALEIFNRNPDIFDMIITDQTMPSMSGVELAHKIFTVKPNLPVILCTGHSTIVDKDKAMAMGIKGFIMKPFGKKKLAETIRKIFTR